MAKRKALCVGIDDYGHPANNLNSCVADVKAVEDILKSKYDFQEVRTLLDGQATTKTVEDELAWLLQEADPEDRLVFQFSGHGYQVPGNGILEEVLVLGDLSFLKDDRLSQFSQQVPPGVFTALLDCCFAGGMEKLVLLPAGAEGTIEIGRPKRWTPIDAKLLQREQALIEKSHGKLRLKPFGYEPLATKAALVKHIDPDAPKALAPA